MSDSSDSKLAELEAGIAASENALNVAENLVEGLWNVVKSEEFRKTRRMFLDSYQKMADVIKGIDEAQKKNEIWRSRLAVSIKRQAEIATSSVDPNKTGELENWRKRLEEFRSKQEEFGIRVASLKYRAELLLDIQSTTQSEFTDKTMRRLTFGLLFLTAALAFLTAVLVWKTLV